jgi:hypothetical protein
MQDTPWSETRPGPTRVLAVVDWSLDPVAIVDALGAESENGEPSSIGILIPARLPGFDWIGNPYASRPCAKRQLEAILRVAQGRGLEVGHAAVGDPERVPAIGAFLDHWKADRVVIYDRNRLFPGHPLSVRNRVARMTQGVVQQVAVATARGSRGRARRCALVDALPSGT